MTAPQVQRREYQKVVMGIDVGLKMGVAILDAFDGSLVSVYTVRSKTASDTRLDAVEGELGRVFHRYNLQAVSIEKPYGANKNGLFPLAEMIGVGKRFCRRMKIPYATPHLAFMKKLATGNGRCDKSAMIAAAKKRWGGDYTDNEADALWVAEWGRVNILNKIEKDV